MRRPRLERIASARAAHRAGDLAAARRGYAALLAEAPEDAELLGLLGVVALQEDRAGEAEALLRRSLAGGDGTARARLRNLNNLLGLLQRQGRGAEARALVAGEVPDWPEAAAAERAVVLPLAEALLALGQPGKARRLLDRALPERAGDAAALGLAGRAALAAGDVAGAAAELAAAAALGAAAAPVLAALAAARHRLGPPEAAAAAARAYAGRFAYHAAPARPGQEMALLVLNRAPRRVETADLPPVGLHHHQNYPAQMARRMADRYRFLSLLADEAPEGAPWAEHRPRLLLSNLANAEEMNLPGRLEAACALVDRIGLPVLNHPRAVFATTRQKNAALLGGIPGLRIPQIERYNLNAAEPDQVVADIEDIFGYPVILRRTTAQMSSHSQLAGHGIVALLVKDRPELRRHLAESGWREFYAVEYVNLRKKEGWFQKLRAYFVAGETFIIQAGAYSQWMVSGWWTLREGIEFYRANPRSTAHLRQLLADPEAALGRRCLDVLDQIRDRLPLDFFGVDFDVDDDGTTVLFEASAAMNIRPSGTAPDDVAIPMTGSDRVDAAMVELIRRRAAAVA